MNLNEALELAAARGQSITITQYTITPPDGYDEADVEAAYAAAAVPAPAVAAPAAGGAGGALAGDALWTAPAAPSAELGELKAKLAAAEQRAHTLQAEVANLQNAAQAGGATTITQDKPETLARIAELEQQLAAAAAAGASVPGTIALDAILGSYEGYSIDVLGLSEKAQKGVNRAGCSTIGETKAALLDGRLMDKGAGNGNLGRLEVIEVANKLLGQAPSVPMPAAAPAPAGGGGASGVPAGIEPVEWSRLLTAVRRKEQAAQAERQKIESATQQLAHLRSQQITPDVQQQIAALEQQKNDADKMHAMFEGQVASFLFVMGLPYRLQEVRTVNGSLEKAGLHHLVNDVPAPEGVPA